MQLIIKMIFLLSFLIFIHEGGHFITAKFFKIKVNKFAIGFGPTIISKTRNKTVYEFNLVPIGGFVSLEGEEELSNKEGSFSNVSGFKKIAVFSAGAIVNILFGIITIFIIATIKQKLEYNTSFIASLNYGGSYINALCTEIKNSLIGIFNGSVGIDNFSGPVGISSIVTNTKGIFEYLYILSLISISLGITNLLPLVPLDGGRIFLLVIEKIKGKPFKRETQTKIQTIGLILLVVFSIIIMINDFKKI